MLCAATDVRTQKWHKTMRCWLVCSSEFEPCGDDSLDAISKAAVQSSRRHGPTEGCSIETARCEPPQVDQAQAVREAAGP